MRLIQQHQGLWTGVEACTAELRRLQQQAQQQQRWVANKDQFQQKNVQDLLEASQQQANKLYEQLLSQVAALRTEVASLAASVAALRTAREGSAAATFPEDAVSAAPRSSADSSLTTAKKHGAASSAEGGVSSKTNNENVQQMLSEAVAEGRLEEAFGLAVSVDLQQPSPESQQWLVRLCQIVDLSSLLEQEPSPLGQPVLVGIVKVFCEGLQTDLRLSGNSTGSLERKARWIAEALTLLEAPNKHIAPQDLVEVRHISRVQG